MGRSYVIGWASGVSLLLGLVASICYSRDLRQIYDAGYFLGQMETAVHFHLQLYRGVEFTYGPLLFYPTVWLSHAFGGFAHPLEAAYVVVFTVSEFLGILLLAYVMQALPIQAGLRRLIFTAFAVLAIPVGLGLNYTLFRFMMPAALVVLCFRLRRRLIVLGACVLLGTLLSLSTSVEIGFSFAAGAVAMALLLAWESRSARPLAILLAPVCALLLFMSMNGAEYFAMMRHFAGGALNLIVEPQLYTILYLIALIWLIPLTVRTALAEGRRDAILIAALYISGLGLLPPSFGRADAGHILFNGLIVFILALIPVGVSTRMVRNLWCTGLIGTLGLTFAIGARLYDRCYMALVPSETARRMWQAKKNLVGGSDQPPPWASRRVEAPADPARLAQVTHGEAIVAPFQLDLDAKDFLEASGQLRPSYYTLGVSGVGSDAENTMIASLDAAQWAAVPAPGPHSVSEPPEMTKLAEGIPFPYKSVRTPFVLGDRLIRDLEQHWQAVESFGSFTLYHRASTFSSPSGADVAGSSARQ